MIKRINVEDIPEMDPFWGCQDEELIAECLGRLEIVTNGRKFKAQLKNPWARFFSQLNYNTVEWNSLSQARRDLRARARRLYDKTSSRGWLKVDLETRERS